MVAKKKSKKKVSKKVSKKAAAKSLPTSAAVPEGFKQLGGGYAETWNCEDQEILIGTVTGEVKMVEIKRGRKTIETRVIEVTEDQTEKRFSVWESAALQGLMDHVADAGVGDVVFIRYDGLGKAKKGQNAPKIMTVAIAE